MANDERVPGSVPGRFYTTHDCIDCNACYSLAPENFRQNDDREFAVVHRQPASAAEENLCREALDACPVEAIRDDGDAT